MSPAVELFHAIADADSARVRRFVVAHGLEAHVRFRNVTYEEVQNDLSARGGTRPPAVWADGRLWQGAEACLERLAKLSPR